MNSLQTELVRNLSSPLSIVILQILLILVVARTCGTLVRRVGQPQVIGEIMAGIMLGPSLLQALASDVHALLFPQDSMQRLYVLSQIGILLFMFIVGLELDLKVLRSKAPSAIVISLTSIIVPFALGGALALLLFPDYGPRESGVLEFALFMGVAMSITAFPVLARIIQEQGLTRTELGTVAITCAAVDDVMGWCLLAIVVGLLNSDNSIGTVWTIALTVGYILFMLVVIRRCLQKYLGAIADKVDLPSGIIAFAIIALLASAWVTEMIGIHALFGAFLIGAVMPENNGFKERLIARIHDVATVILLPLFFAFTGLRTQLGLLNDFESWLTCGVVLIVAILGKFGGAVLGARLTHHSGRVACILGALMNTRGLMELIVLNVGYDLGILTAKIFTIMVVMAVITTMMTGPIVRLLTKSLKESPADVSD